jgi:uncharacterized protein YxjI
MLRQRQRKHDPGWIVYTLPGAALSAQGASIEADGRPAFRCELLGSSPWSALVLRDLAGHELYRVDAPAVQLRDSLTIGSGSEIVAVVRKVLEAPLREKFRIDVGDGRIWSATGEIAAEDYRVRDGRQTVATVVPSADVPGGACAVTTAISPDATLILMVVMAIDALAPTLRA